jgi:hypothetical protein
MQINSSTLRGNVKSGPVAETFLSSRAPANGGGVAISSGDCFGWLRQPRNDKFVGELGSSSSIQVSKQNNKGENT